MNSVLKYYHTLKDLKYEQLLYQFILIFYKRSNIPTINYVPQKKFKNQNKLIFLKKESLVNINKKKVEFKFLNKVFKYNKNINWNDKKLNLTEKYNLNYFDYLIGKKANLKDNQFLVEHWIKKNSDISLEPWDPYVSSVRIVNWIKWSISNSYNKQFFLNSLIKQSLLLSKRIEYHILGNHVLANAKALIFAGLYFSGSESNSFYKKGIDLLIRELNIQINKDGGHFERSPMYHCIILEDLLDIISIHKYFKVKANSLIKVKSNQMLKFLENIAHLDNEIPFFGDSCFGIAKNYKELLQYRNRLFPKAPIRKKNIKNQITFLKETGYLVNKNKQLSFIANIAEISPKYQPGHSHADLLSFELSLFGKRVFVNSGISTYERNNIRMSERSTKMHNTVEINNRNSSDVWASFRVGKKAKVIKKNIYLKNNYLKAEIQHDGYKTIFNKITHNRRFLMNSKQLNIYDYISGNTKNIISRIYIHPEVKVDNNELILPNKRKILFKSKNCKINIKGSYWSHGFNKKLKNKFLEIKPLKNEYELIIMW